MKGCVDLMIDSPWRHHNAGAYSTLFVKTVVDGEVSVSRNVVNVHMEAVANEPRKGSCYLVHTFASAEL